MVEETPGVISEVLGMNPEDPVELEELDDAPRVGDLNNFRIENFWTRGILEAQVEPD